MQDVKIARYAEDELAISELHQLDDALDIVAFLTAEDFVVAQLLRVHGKTQAQAKALARRISSHAKIADMYARLSLTAPPHISFLPGYYSILNLAKIQSLAGPYSNTFDHHSRWHGATYQTRGRTSRGLFTEEIRIRKGGALALFYRTLMASPINSDRVLKLRDIYPLVPGIGSELSIITGSRSPVVEIGFRAEINAGRISAEAIVSTITKDGRRRPYKGTVRQIPCLKGFRKKPGSSNIFSRVQTVTAGATIQNALRQIVQTPLIASGPLSHLSKCHRQGSALPFPDEFATALAFFHLASICRYNPEFLDKLSQSKFWPMLLQLRRHGMYYFLISTWSYLIQKNYDLRSMPG